MEARSQPPELRTHTGRKRPEPPDAAELSRLPEGFLLSGAPLELDLGCARGHFLVAVAKEFPAVRFLGVDFQLSRVRETRRKLSHAGLQNAAAVRGEILETVARIVPRRSVRRIHLLFPDPWPKRRHANRRIFQSGALELFARVLQPGGELRFVTDDEPYFRQAVKVVRANSSEWRELPDAPLDGWPQTEFQARFARLGLPIYGFVAQFCGTAHPE